MKEKIVINSRLKEYLDEKLSYNISNDDINYILYDDYYDLDNKDSSSKISSLFDSDYTYIILLLSLGYNFENMLMMFPKLVNKEEIDSIKKEMETKDITIDQIRALNRYSYGYDVIVPYIKNNSREIILKNLVKKYKTELKKVGYNSKDIKLVLKFILSLDYKNPLYISLDSLIKYFKNFKIYDDTFIISKVFLKKIDLLYNIEDTIDSLNECIKHELPNSVVLYKSFKTSSLKVLIDKLSKTEKVVLFKGKSFTSTSTLYDDPLVNADGNDVILKIYVPKGTKGILVSPFSNTNSSIEEVLLDEYEFYASEINTKFIDKNNKQKLLIKGLLISKDKSGYKDLEQEQIITENTNYRQELNRIISMDNEDDFISTFTINGNDVKHTLERENNNKKEVLLEKEFPINSKEDSLEQYIIDFSRRIPICKVITNNNSIIIDGYNSKMKINNIDNVFASQIEKIVPQISSDLYYKKKLQEFLLRKKGEPLLFLSVRNMRGNINIIVMSLITIIITIIIFVCIFVLYR